MLVPPGTAATGGRDVRMDPILQRPYEIKDSHLHIPDAPGVGLDWNEDVVARNLYEA